jgi:hypothetical protein
MEDAARRARDELVGQCPLLAVFAALLTLRKASMQKRLQEAQAAQDRAEKRAAQLQKVRNA